MTDSGWLAPLSSAGKQGVLMEQPLHIFTGMWGGNVLQGYEIQSIDAVLYIQHADSRILCLFPIVISHIDNVQVCSVDGKPFLFA